MPPNATQRPWRLDERNYILGADGRYLNLQLSEVSALIVRAVNAHDAMREALEAAWKAIMVTPRGEQDSTTWRELADRIKSALSRAQED